MKKKWNPMEENLKFFVRKWNWITDVEESNLNFDVYSGDQYIFLGDWALFPYIIS